MFVYIRTNEWCDNKDVYKVGITKSIIDRNNTYITGEIIKGRFVKIFKLNNNHNQLKAIDKIIKSKFEKLNVYHQGGGKEFYKRIISEELEKFFIKHHIKFQLVNEEDLKRLNRTIYNPVKFINFIKKYIEFKKTITPKPYQKDINYTCYHCKKTTKTQNEHLLSSLAFIITRLYSASFSSLLDLA